MKYNVSYPLDISAYKNNLTTNFSFSKNDLVETNLPPQEFCK